MNQSIQNLVITLAVLLIFMFGYLYLKPVVPADEVVTVKGFYVSNFYDWDRYMLCDNGDWLSISDESRKELSQRYGSIITQASQPIYFELEGFMVHSAINGKEIRSELKIDKIVNVSAEPVENCPAFQKALTRT